MASSKGAWTLFKETLRDQWAGALVGTLVGSVVTFPSTLYYQRHADVKNFVEKMDKDNVVFSLNTVRPGDPKNSLTFRTLLEGEVTKLFRSRLVVSNLKEAVDHTTKSNGIVQLENPESQEYMLQSITSRISSLMPAAWVAQAFPEHASAKLPEKEFVVAMTNEFYSDLRKKKDSLPDTAEAAEQVQSLVWPGKEKELEKRLAKKKRKVRVVIISVDDLLKYFGPKAKEEEFDTESDLHGDRVRTLKQMHTHYKRQIAKHKKKQLYYPCVYVMTLALHPAAIEPIQNPLHPAAIESIQDSVAK